MAILASESFDNYPSAVIGNNIAAVNTIFSNIATNGTIKYAAGLEGSFSCRNTSTNTATCRESGFTGTKIVFRWVWQYDSVPSVQTNIARAEDGSAVHLSGIWLNTGGTIVMKDGPTQVGSATSALSVNTTYAIEYMIDLPNDTQTLRVYNSLSKTGVTPISEITGAITTTSLAYNGGATNIGQFEFGRRTASTGAVQIFDSYERADDWIAVSSTPSTTNKWIANFNGTAGQTILVGDDSDFDAVSGSPTYVGDGVDTQQVCMQCTGTAGTTRYVSTLLPTPVDNTLFERFYFKIVTLPDAGPGFTFWVSQSADQATTMSYMKATVGTVTGTAVITVGGTYYDTDLATNVTDDVASFAAIPIGKWVRCEIDYIVNTDGDSELTYRLYTGNNLHTTIVSQSMTQVWVTQNWRRHKLQRTGVAGTAPEIRFDCWRMDNDKAFGPITNPYQPTLPQQWRFWEWNGTDEVVLSPTYYDGTTEQTVANSYDIAATTVQGDGGGNNSGRFPGDPGVGKILLGTTAEGTTSMERTERGKLRAASTPGYPANATLTYGIGRTFLNAQFPDPWGSHSDTNWKDSRWHAANYGLDHLSITCDGWYNSIINEASGFNNWVQTLVNGLNDLRDRYGANIILNWSNEPDAFGNTNNTPADLTGLRRVARKMHFILKDAGCTNFCTSTPTTINDTAIAHQNRTGLTVRTTGTSWPDGRADGLHYYIPDWKGTKTNWANAWSPNPADFYQDGEMDEWGYGRGPVTSIWARNTYCFHAKGRGDDPQGLLPNVWGWSSATWQSHRDTTGNKHGAQVTTFLRGLYGGNGIPQIIGEWGYSPRDLSAASDAVATADFWAGVCVPEFAANNVVGINLWRIPNATEQANGGNAQDGWLFFGMGMRADKAAKASPGAGEKDPSYTNQPDSPTYVNGAQDARRRGFAAMWSRNEVVNPPSRFPIDWNHN